MSLLLDPQAWLSLLTLTFLEIILGVDNIIFISILAGKVKPEQRAKARKLGLMFALVTRVLLLCTLAWLAKLTEPLLTLFAHSFSGRDLILIFGGIFLIGKSTHEIHAALEGPEPEATANGGAGKAVASLFSVVTQIAFIDIIFSLDSVITAVGIAQHLPVMITAVVLSILVMLWLSGPISEFVERHPTIKMLALSFLIMIGVLLVVDGFGQHVSKAYIYFAMGFSLAVEMLNIRMRSTKHPVHLHGQLTVPVVETEKKAE